MKNFAANFTAIVLGILVGTFIYRDVMTPSFRYIGPEDIKPAYIRPAMQLEPIPENQHPNGCCCQVCASPEACKEAQKAVDDGLRMWAAEFRRTVFNELSRIRRMQDRQLH